MDRIEKIITKASWRQQGLRVVIEDGGIFVATFNDDKFRGKHIVDSLYVNMDEFDKIYELRKKVI